MRWRCSTAVLAVALAIAGCAPATEGPPSSGSVAPSVAEPPAGGFDYQLGGSYPPPEGVEVVVRQWFDGEPLPEGYSICYVNAFQTEAEPDSPDAASAWPPGTVWTDAEDPAWPGEHPIDLGTSELREAAAAFVRTRFQACAERGFDAVELDNLDTYTRYTDAPFDRDDAIAYATLLVESAGELGLAVGQKNTTDLLDVGPDEIGFAFAVVEECGAYEECELFTAAYGTAVLAVEYTPEGFAAACDAVGGTAAVILRDLELTTPDEGTYVYESC